MIAIATIFLLIAGLVVVPAVQAASIPVKTKIRFAKFMPFFGVFVLLLYRSNVVNVSAWWGIVFYTAMLFLFTLWTGFGMYLSYLCYSCAKTNKFLYVLLNVWFMLSVSTVMIETTARIFPVYTSWANNPGEKFFWPDRVYFPLNNFGHRDRDFIIPKPDNTYRIVLIGDSYTEGAGLSRQQTMGYLLERQITKLLRDTANVEVYNLGHCGMNTKEEVDVLLHDGDKLQPDLVFLNYVMNDAETHPLTITPADEPMWYKELNRILITSAGSYAYYRFIKSFRLIEEHFATTSDYLAAQHDKNKAGWQDVSAALRRMELWLNEHRCEGIALIWPIFQNDWTSSAAKINKQVEEELKSHQLTVFDLNDLFQQTNEPLVNFALSRVDHHPNANANRLVSKLMELIVVDTKSFQSFIKSKDIGRMSMITNRH
ncbi:hypothetical protein C3Y92_20225 (plasmid) [Solidesulfovibrio carbinolicus]|uniref:SGNH hydrolase-type esterase domain-containing protein n=2 Tax=Solidesulfovibrio carbinolicus TaxID=296842 RepID=A0A4P6HQK4_9BACT|nr:hypothetical protein C3Y92_20225 [Solidesulfovibrio carbinolicus]